MTEIADQHIREFRCPFDDNGEKLVVVANVFWDCDPKSKNKYYVRISVGVGRVVSHDDKTQIAESEISNSKVFIIDGAASNQAIIDDLSSQNELQVAGLKPKNIQDLHEKIPEELAEDLFQRVKRCVATKLPPNK